MRQTWRWFGPRDAISIDDLLQAAMENVVSVMRNVASRNIRPSEHVHGFDWC